MFIRSPQVHTSRSRFWGVLAAIGFISSPVLADSQPVPTGPPNSPHQSPAFPGQTRAPQLANEITVQTSVIASGFNHPWAIEFLPDGRLLVTERQGDLRIVSQQGKVSDPIKGVPKVDNRDQGGLLDVALDKDFNSNRQIYFSYSEPRGDQGNGTTVARARLSKDDTELTDLNILFRQTPAWKSTKHFGSRLVWGEGDLLYITLGERSLPEPRQLAQDLTTHLGKVVRIHADGSVPRDNPFADATNSRAEIWSYGHRNIQGATLHPQTGRLWTIEHGPKGGDELNAPEPGKNYGWPVITYGEDYSGTPIGKGITAKSGMEQPIYYWDPVIAPGGMMFYQGDAFSEWNDNLIIASLRPGGLVRLQLDGQRVVGEARMLGERLGRVRDVKADQQGNLWVITDKGNGELIKITRQAP